MPSPPRTSPSAAPSVTPPPPASARRLVFSASATSRQDLSPADASAYTRIVNENAQHLAKCFMNQHLPDAWSATGQITFYTDKSSGSKGVRGVKVTVFHEAAIDTSFIGAQIKDCVYGDVLMWRFPSFEGEPPKTKGSISFLAGMQWRTGP